MDFKSLMLTFKACGGLAPEYVRGVLTSYKPECNLRSFGNSFLAIPLSLDCGMLCQRRSRKLTYCLLLLLVVVVVVVLSGECGVVKTKSSLEPLPGSEKMTLNSKVQLNGREAFT